MGDNWHVRRVRVVRIKGESEDDFPMRVETEGWEKDQPWLGKPYCLYKDDGEVLCTRAIVREYQDGFETENAKYTLKVLEPKREKGGVLLQEPRHVTPTNKAVADRFSGSNRKHHIVVILLIFFAGVLSGLIANLILRL